MRSEDWIDLVCRDVSELSDRSSPEDAPDQMLVTAQELRDIIESHAPPPTPAPLGAPEHLLALAEGELRNAGHLMKAGGIPVNGQAAIDLSERIASHRAAWPTAPDAAQLVERVAPMVAALLRDAESAIAEHRGPGQHVGTPKVTVDALRLANVCRAIAASAKGGAS